MTREPSPQRLADLARSAGAIAVDTEFMGEGRYRTQLCLVQIAAGAGATQEVGIVDPLDPPTDPSPLREVLADPSITVVVHAGRQDVALLRRVWGTEVVSLFDTQVAAGFAGLRAQASYDTLLREVLGVRLRKGAGYTRWDKRPLTDEQLRYAREDVVDMLALADELQARLAAAGRLEWAREECRALERSSDERDVDVLFARLPRIAGLDPVTRAVAHELVLWREALAQRIDRPASNVLNETALVELARRRPRDNRALEQIRGLGRVLAAPNRAALLDAIERGLGRPPLPGHSVRRAPALDSDAPAIALGEAFVRARAQDAGIAYELIAARADLTRIVVALREGAETELRDGVGDGADTGDGDGDAQEGNGERTAIRTLTGWRRELVGEELLALLRGHGALSVQGGRVVKS